MSSPDQPRSTVTSDEVRVRRAPKYGRFIIAGALLGFIGALIATTAFPVDEKVGFVPMLAYLSCYGIPAGVVVFSVIAIVVDRATARRARTVQAERESVEAPPIEGELED